VLTRPLHYAIVDEVDSILLDECRNPLMVTAAASVPLWRFPIAAKVRSDDNDRPVSWLVSNGCRQFIFRLTVTGAASVFLWRMPITAKAVKPG